MSKWLNIEIATINSKKLEEQNKMIIDKFRKNLSFEGIIGETQNDVAIKFKLETIYLNNNASEAILIKYYEEKYNKNIINGNFREAVYYNKRIINLIEDKILKKYC